MMVSLTTNAARARLWLPTAVTWASKSGKTMGSAAFFVPRNSPIWQTGVIPANGGAIMQISDGTRLWSGITDSPQWGPDGAQVAGLEVGQWAGIRPLKRRRTFLGAPAGLIAKKAAEDAFVGLSFVPVAIGPCVECAPLIPYFEFDGTQNLQKVLSYLQDETGHEWGIDHETLEFTWQTQIGQYHEGLIVDAGELINKIGRPSLTEQYREVTEYDSFTRQSFTAWNGTTPLTWPSHTSVEV